MSVSSIPVKMMESVFSAQISCTLEHFLNLLKSILALKRLQALSATACLDSLVGHKKRYYLEKLPY